MKVSLSQRQARRIALAAQGLAGARPASPPGRTRLRGMIERLGVIQIDSVNVLARTHYLPAFSRLGPYGRELLEKEAWGRRPSLFEYWGHEASLLPLALHPLFRWRMERAREGDTWTGLARYAAERRDDIAAVLARIEHEGPLTGGDFAEGPRKSGWWNWSDGKRALEWLFWGGLITTRTRRGFERVYDLTERVIPREILDLPTPTPAQARRGLLAVAAKAMGIATEGDLRDYFRMRPGDTRERIAELVESGEIIAAEVQGWRRGAFLHRDALAPRRVRAQALLSPFDNLIWRRERTERLFGVKVRLEIYTPAHKREHGYYVLPLLVGDRLVARCDLKADRQASVLLVQAAHCEPKVDPDAAATALAAELTTMAKWLCLGAVQVRRKGELAGALAKFLQ